MGLLVDTNVIIDYLRGHAAALAYVDGLSSRPSTSVIVVAELYAGIRDGVERRSLEALLANTTILPLEQATAVEGGLIGRQYAKSHGVSLADAMIAATAKLHALTLVTLNVKHFSMLSDVHAPYTKP